MTFAVDILVLRGRARGVESGGVTTKILTTRSRQYIQVETDEEKKGHGLHKSKVIYTDK